MLTFGGVVIGWRQMRQIGRRVGGIAYRSCETKDRDEKREGGVHRTGVSNGSRATGVLYLQSLLMPARLNITLLQAAITVFTAITPLAGRLRGGHAAAGHYIQARETEGRVKQRTAMHYARGRSSLLFLPCRRGERQP